MQLVKATDPILRRRVPQFTWPTVGNALLNLAPQSDQLRRMVEENEWGSLAANQVGLSINMLVLGQRCFPGVSKFDCKVFINPWVGRTDPGVCLKWSSEETPNFPDIQIRIRRPEIVKLSGYGLTGKYITQYLTSDGARAALRALDYLRGTTILDHSWLGYWGYEGTGLFV